MSWNIQRTISCVLFATISNETKNKPETAKKTHTQQRASESPSQSDEMEIESVYYCQCSKKNRALSVCVVYTSVRKINKMLLFVQQKGGLNYYHVIIQMNANSKENGKNSVDFYNIKWSKGGSSSNGIF